jgi:hypothetical protein
MPDMTEEEYKALDELITHTTPKLKSGAGGILTKQRELLKFLDDVSANYIQTRAEATNKMPSQIIGELVRKEIFSTIQ